MRYLVASLLFFCVQSLHAQKQVPDSTMKEFTRLTCECATLMQVDKGDMDKAFENFGTCVRTTIGVFEQNGWFKKELFSDSAWVLEFDRRLEEQLTANCPVFKNLVDKLDRKAPEPHPAVEAKYFIATEAMTGRNMELNVNAGNVHMQRWSAKDFKNAAINMVFDIRFVFDSEKDAADYFEIKMGELSEGGTPLTNSLTAQGADQSKVFGADEKMLGMFGDLDMAQYNFVFRIKNVVAKVFVSGTKKVTYNDALVFAKEAIARIKAAK